MLWPAVTVQRQDGKDLLPVPTPLQAGFEPMVGV